MIGGSEVDKPFGIKQVPDGGFVLFGATKSNNGDVSGNNGGYDGWLVKVNSLGYIEWQQCIGGEKNDLAYALALSSDGGYVLGGRYNNLDAWIMKTKGTNTSISNLNQEAKINIFPNPAFAVLNINIEWQKPEVSTLAIYDITGRICT